MKLVIVLYICSSMTYPLCLLYGHERLSLRAIGVCKEFVISTRLMQAHKVKILLDSYMYM